MRASTFVRKPPGKRGVNKATMDQPQEEFIEPSAQKKEKAAANPDGAPPKPEALPRSGNSSAD
jgi:hypothetical protein